MINERVIFTESGHQYRGEQTGLRYESVSGLNKLVLAPDIDWDAILIKKANKLGITPEELQAQWDEAKNCGTKAGTALHNAFEQLYYVEPYYEWRGKSYEVIKCHVEGDMKYQTVGLQAGRVYPECILSLTKDHIRLAGQADALFVDKKSYIHLTDIKTDREIAFNSFKPWKGRSQRMKPPFDYIEDANFLHYSFKMTCYCFMAVQANPSLKIGTITLEHTPVERDENKLPIWGADGIPIAKSRTEYEIDYKKWEPIVRDVLNQYYKITK